MLSLYFQIKLGEGRELPEGQGLLAFCPLAGVLVAGVGHTLHLIRSANIEQQVPVPATIQYSAGAAFRDFSAPECQLNFDCHQEGEQSMDKEATSVGDP
jgi:hypothetical protein